MDKVLLRSEDLDWRRILRLRMRLDTLALDARVGAGFDWQPVVIKSKLEVWMGYVWVSLNNKKIRKDLCVRVRWNLPHRSGGGKDQRTQHML